MTNQEIFELITRFEHSCLQRMNLQNGDFSLELEKNASSAAPAAVSPKLSIEPQIDVPGDDAVTAPLVGVFYTSPAPGEAPFVTVGSKVEKGQTLCLMEAMKMLSEVPAPCDCIITEVIKANGELAAFGEPLFRYKPC